MNILVNGPVAVGPGHVQQHSHLSGQRVQYAMYQHQQGTYDCAVHEYKPQSDYDLYLVMHQSGYQSHLSLNVPVRDPTPPVLCSFKFCLKY